LILDGKRGNTPTFNTLLIYPVMDSQGENAGSNPAGTKNFASQYF